MDSICSAVNELEEHGYVIRKRIRNSKGRLTDIQYTILEKPQLPLPEQEKQKQENPVLGSPVLGTENSKQSKWKQPPNGIIKKPLFWRLGIYAPKQNTVALRRF